MVSQRAAQMGMSIGAADWPNSDIGNDRLFVWNLQLSELELAGWHLVSSRRSCLPTGVCIARSTWQHTASPSENLLLVQSYECPSRSVAHETLLELLSQFQVPLELQESTSHRIGMLFIDPNETNALLNIGNLVVRVARPGTALRCPHGSSPTRSPIGSGPVRRSTRRARLGPLPSSSMWAISLHSACRRRCSTGRATVEPDPPYACSPAAEMLQRRTTTSSSSLPNQVLNDSSATRPTPTVPRA